MINDAAAAAAHAQHAAILADSRTMGETQDKGPTFSLASAIKAAVGFAASNKPTKNALSAHHAVPAAADTPNDADATSSEADNESALRASQLTSPASDAVHLRAGVAYIRCVHPRTHVI